MRLGCLGDDLVVATALGVENATDAFVPRASMRGARLS